MHGGRDTRVQRRKWFSRRVDGVCPHGMIAPEHAAIDRRKAIFRFCRYVTHFFGELIAEFLRNGERFCEDGLEIREPPRLVDLRIGVIEIDKWNVTERRNTPKDALDRAGDQYVVIANNPDIGAASFVRGDL